MERSLLVIFLGVLVLFDVTATFPISRGHGLEYGLEPEAGHQKSSGFISTETHLTTKTDFSRHAHDLNSEIHKHRKHVHGSTQARLVSRDESRAANPKKNSKFIAISIFVGCVIFMSLSFAITCCVRRVKATKRVKEATHVDVRARQEPDLPQQVSKIDDDAVHIDVGQY